QSRTMSNPPSHYVLHQSHDVTNNTIVLLMPPRSPRSTLFPYTTLFRSGRSGEVTGLVVLRRFLVGGFLRRLVGRFLGRALRRKPDRKSTRLNSSHLGISYAVFCLKKKKGSWNG